MANPTTNFGWVMPTSTDLVTDLPADFAVFGQGVDTTLADLKGGTTGQVLSKTSNTDMDFTWVTQDDANAIQNTIVDAKGDIITATAADTPARLAVGANDYVLTADSTQATGLKWAAVASGGMTLLSTTTVSGTPSTVTVSSISGSYNSLQIEIAGIGTNAASGQIYGTFNSITTGYNAIIASTNSTTDLYSSGTNIPFSGTSNVTDTGGDDQTVTLRIDRYAQTTGYKPYTVYGTYKANTAQRGFIGGGGIATTAALTSFTITCTGGAYFGSNMVIKIYGVK